jgi:tRNA (cytidine/uridine-2'-O-)-methyltransferase
MFNIVLYEPEIAPNTGNIIRLCANSGCHLHLIEPLGFEPDNARLKRAGLDYQDWSRITIHADFQRFLESEEPDRVFTVSTHNPTIYTEPDFVAGDSLVFGPETRGLPAQIRDSVSMERRITLPMHPNNRSLNLANSVSIVAYEAWRQNAFAGSVASEDIPQGTDGGRHK